MAKSRENRATQLAERRAELSGLGTGDRGDTPKRARGTLTLLFFLRVVFLHLRLVLTWFGYVTTPYKNRIV
jgi:hypothetical protein